MSRHGARGVIKHALVPLLDSLLYTPRINRTGRPLNNLAAAAGKLGPPGKLPTGETGAWRMWGRGVVPEVPCTTVTLPRLLGCVLPHGNSRNGVIRNSGRSRCPSLHIQQHTARANHTNGQPRGGTTPPHDGCVPRRVGPWLWARPPPAARPCATLPSVRSGPFDRHGRACDCGLRWRHVCTPGYRTPRVTVIASHTCWRQQRRGRGRPLATWWWHRGCA